MEISDDRMAQLFEDMGEIKATTKETRSILKGNGDPGLIAQVAAHEKIINEIKGMFQLVKWLALLFAGSTVVNVVITIIKK